MPRSLLQNIYKDFCVGPHCQSQQGTFPDLLKVMAQQIVFSPEGDGFSLLQDQSQETCEFTNSP